VDVIVRTTDFPMNKKCYTGWPRTTVGIQFRKNILEEIGSGNLLLEKHTR